jgi:hypothetical protein
MKRILILGLLAASLLSAAPHKKATTKHGTRIPGVVNAATYPGRHPVKTVKPFYKAGKRVLW